MTGKIIKLKNPVRHVYVVLLDDGRWFVEFKKLEKPRNVVKTTFVVTEEAMQAMVYLYLDLDKERFNA